MELAIFRQTVLDRRQAVNSARTNSKNICATNPIETSRKNRNADPAIRQEHGRERKEFRLDSHRSRQAREEREKGAVPSGRFDRLRCPQRCQRLDSAEYIINAFPYAKSSRRMTIDRLSVTNACGSPPAHS